MPADKPQNSKGVRAGTYIQGLGCRRSWARYFSSLAGAGQQFDWRKQVSGFDSAG